MNSKIDPIGRPVPTLFESLLAIGLIALAIVGLAAVLTGVNPAR